MGAYKLCNNALSITVLLRERLRTNKQNNISIAVFNYCLNYYEQELCFYFNENVEVEVKTSRLIFDLHRFSLQSVRTHKLAAQCII